MFRVGLASAFFTLHDCYFKLLFLELIFVVDFGMRRDMKRHVNKRKRLRVYAKKLKTTLGTHMSIIKSLITIFLLNM